MKKLFLLLCIAICYTATGQEIAKNAIGLRLSDASGFGAEVSYQRAIKESNRLELDLGLRSGRNYDGFKLVGLYQWIWNIDSGFNWYAGGGAGAGSYRYESDFFENDFRRDYNETFFLAAGSIGIEYNFDIPLLVSFDARPEISSRKSRGNSTWDSDFDIGLSIRYQF